MARSSKKGPFCAPSLLEKVKKVSKENKKTIIKTWSRGSTILPSFVGLTFGVHTGRDFSPVHVMAAMIGRKLGEFAQTRTFKGHSGDRKAKK